MYDAVCEVCVCVCVQEREQAMELWQTASQELDRLQQLYQKTLSDGQHQGVERQHLKVGPVLLQMAPLLSFSAGFRTNLYKPIQTQEAPS